MHTNTKQRGHVCQVSTDFCFPNIWSHSSPHWPRARGQSTRLSPPSAAITDVNHYSWLTTDINDEMLAKMPTGTQRLCVSLTGQEGQVRGHLTDSPWTRPFTFCQRKGISPWHHCPLSMAESLQLAPSRHSSTLNREPGRASLRLLDVKVPYWRVVCMHQRTLDREGTVLRSLWNRSA